MLGFVGRAINTAGRAVETLVNTATQEVSKAATDIVSDAKDYFNVDNFSLKGMGKGALEGFKDMLSGKGGLGHVVDGALDGLGLPDWVGNFVGAAVSFMTFDPSGYELLLKGGGMIAGEMGHEGLEKFLDVAGDVTGMAVGIGKQVALTTMTGGAGAAGALGQVAAHAGKAGQAMQWISKGAQIAGHVNKAMDVVGALKDGNVLGAGMALFDVFGGNLGVVGDLFGDSGLGDVLGGLLGEGGGLIGDLLGKLGPELLSELPVDDILGQLGLGTDAFSGLAGPIVEIGKELLGQLGESIDLPGTAIFGSEAGQQLVQILAGLLSEQVSGVLSEIGVSAEAVIDAAAQTTAGMIDVAAHDAQVAMELIELLMQMSSMASSALVSDLVGAQIHC